MSRSSSNSAVVRLNQTIQFKSNLRADKVACLQELVARRPIQQGVAELITYLSLKDEIFRIVDVDHAAFSNQIWSSRNR